VLAGNAEQAGRAWRGGRDELGEVSIKHSDLTFELAHTLGDGAQRELCRLQRLVQSRPIGP